jgi:hypothetical protein
MEFNNFYRGYVYSSYIKEIVKSISRMFLMDVIDERLHTSYGLQLNDEE